MDSKLQIISGEKRGRKLYLPDGARPTQNIARAALFNILTPFIDTTKQIVVWDAFAGSGAFGLEFLSRYSNASVIFTDNSDESIKTVRKNLGLIKKNANILQTDAISAIKQFGMIAAIVFIDPPYAEFNLGAEFVRKLTQSVKSGTIVIWEFEKIQKMPEFGTSWQIIKDKTYGRARFVIMRRL